MTVFYLDHIRLTLEDDVYRSVGGGERLNTYPVKIQNPPEKQSGKVIAED